MREGTAPVIHIAPDLSGRERALVAAAGLPHPVAVVCDPNTARVSGWRVAAALGSACTLLEAPHADLDTAEALVRRCQGAGSLLAVGSGTLNDLVKYAAHRLGRPCAVFATAASQNGWLTATASLAVHGIKRSLPVGGPRAAFFDLGVLAAAPRRLRLAGIGDALCRPVVEADLRLAETLLGTEYDPAWFEPLRQSERALRRCAAAAAAGELSAVRLLTEVLVGQSLVMREAGTSAPASQGEHAIAHLVECFARPAAEAFHGELVALATVTLATIQKRCLAAASPPPLHPVQIDNSRLEGLFGASADEARQAIAAMGLDDPRQVAALSLRLQTCWPSLRAALQPLVGEACALRSLFEAVGLPVRPDQLGLDRAFYREAVALAFALRPRLGFLALATLSRQMSAHAW